MKLVEPSVELWLQGYDDESVLKHIALCARVCYQSDKTDGNEAMVQRLIKNKHLSMFRHATYYFRVPTDTENKEAITHLLKNKYVLSAEVKSKGMMFFAVNGQAWFAFHAGFQAYLKQFRVKEEEIAEAASDLKAEQAFNLLGIIRTTVLCTTQISTSRELNRVSPNNIAEQSTRYVNFGKRGGITICKPWWYNAFTPWWQKCFALTCWKIEEWMYDLALRFGMKAEDARGFLPIDTGTRVVYTYSGKEWRHIMDLRLRDKTGKAHPNAKQIAQAIQEKVNMKMKVLHREYSI